MADTTDPADPTPVTITGTHPDRVEVIRTWDVEAPDWTPPGLRRTRTIAVRKVIGVWVDGKLERAGVQGPYRLASGKLAELGEYRTGWGGSGTPDFRPAENYTHGVSYSYSNGQEISSYTRASLPEWVWDFLAEHGPVG